MRQLLALAAAATFCVGTLAQSDQAPVAHHGPGASAGAAKAASAPAAKAPTPAQMDMQLKAMQDLHRKMMAARTPEEREALMAEHRTTLREGMAMMERMHGDAAVGPGGRMGGGMAMGPQMMGRRMDMMESMMQLMMDRESDAPAAK